MSSSIKALPLGMLTSPVTAPSTYDQTKPFYSNRIAIRPDPISSTNAVGVIPNTFFDVFDDTGATPATGICVTPNGRMFVSKGFTTSVLTVSAYTVNTTLGTKGSWIGDLKFTFAAAATNTLRGIQVNDTNSSSMIITFSSIHTTAANGGLFGVWGVPITDFVTSSVITYPYATTTPSLTKTVYKCVDVIGSNTVTTAVGHDFDHTSGGTISDYYVFTGTAALPKIYKFSMASPPSGTVTAGEASSNFTFATGVFTALTGTIISASNSISTGKLGHTALSGFACLTYMTSTNIYASKLSDITSGAVSLPSQVTTTTTLDANKYANAFLTPTISYGIYDQLTDRFYALSSTGKMFCKQLVNNDPNGIVFGTNDVIKDETGATGLPNEFGGITSVSLTVQNGFLYLVNTSVGQRGVVQMDAGSDRSNNLSFILSPVVTVGPTTVGLDMHSYKALSKRSVKSTLGYRTSNFSVDPNAGLAAFLATFTFVDTNIGNLGALSNINQVQFISMFTVMGDSNTNSSQIIEQYYIFTDLAQMSDNWVGGGQNTTQNVTTPAYTSFRLQTAYASTVPTMYFRAYDDSGNLVASANTVSNPTLFKYSTNNGTSWNALGTIPNTALTTELRYEWATPPGVAIRCSLRES